MNKHLSLKPYHLNDSLWIYEEARGLVVVHRICDDVGTHIRTELFTIPVKKIRNYLKRKDKK